MRSLIFTLLAIACLGMLPSEVWGQTATDAPLLHVTTEPEAADITFDGALQGQSPLTLSNLKPGPHLLAVVKPGFREISHSIQLAPTQRMALNLALEPVTGLVLLHSTPAGADVEIDGAHRGTTPMLLTDLPVGRYRAHFTLSGYLPKDIDLTIEDRTPLRIPLELVSDSAALTITSTPSGATVTVNGLARGTTPCTLERVATGESELQVKMSGYNTLQRTIRLAAGQTEALDMVLQAIPATLDVISDPVGARLYVNDQYRGETPMTLTNLPPATYQLRVEKKGYDMLSRPVFLQRAQKRTEEMRMVSNAGVLEVITHPVGVRVLIDGKERGVTPAMANDVESLISAPLKIELVDVGERRVQLVREGFFEKTVTVTIKRQETTPIQESLKRRFIPNTEIQTLQGVLKGVFIDEDVNGKIRLEIRPGVIKSVAPEDIVSRRAIK